VGEVVAQVAAVGPGPVGADGLPGRLGPGSNMSNRSRSAAMWPRSRPGEAYARWVMPCRAASATSCVA
jgi:hypothetical protein